jgi:hypothetical protein
MGLITVLEAARFPERGGNSFMVNHY